MTAGVQWVPVGMAEMIVDVDGIDRGHALDIERRLRCREISVRRREVAGSVRFRVRSIKEPRALEYELRRVVRRSLGRDPRVVVRHRSTRSAS